MASNRILAAQRDLTRLKGEWGGLVAQAARAQGQISEMELQILALDQTMQTESSKELREMEARLAELAERKIAAQDQLMRINLRAPQSGIVHDLAVHTVGGVIGAGRDGNDDRAERGRPKHRGQDRDVRHRPGACRAGSIAPLSRLQSAHDAGDQRLVTQVGADLSKEAQTNPVFYTARSPSRGRQTQVAEAGPRHAGRGSSSPPASAPPSPISSNPSPTSSCGPSGRDRRDACLRAVVAAPGMTASYPAYSDS